MELEEDLPPDVEEQGDIDAPEDNPEDSPDVSDETPTFEDIASGMGWSPKDKWRGDPEKWKPAHEFIASTADINAKLNTRLSGMEQRLDTMARTSARMTEQALAKQRQELLDARSEAFESGDAEAFNKADKALDELGNVAIEQAAPPPETQAWMEKNAWFGKDRDATNWAQNRAGELAEKGIGEARQLQIVEREARQLFPEYFEEPKQPAKPVPLSQPGKRGNPAPAKNTYANLPPEAKKAADDFAKAGRCTKEEYAKIYFEEQEA